MFADGRRPSTNRPVASGFRLRSFGTFQSDYHNYNNYRKDENMSTGFDDGYDPFAMDEVDPSKCTPGRDLLPEGFYRFGVAGIEMEATRGKKGDLALRLEVLDCKDKSLIGAEHTEYLGWPNPSYQSLANQIRGETLLAYCIAARCLDPDTGREITKELIEERKAAGKKGNIKWISDGKCGILGREFIGMIKHKEGKQRDDGSKSVYANIDKRVWRVDDPKMAGVLTDDGKPAATDDPLGDLPT
jgi:hypothetical protein